MWRHLTYVHMSSLESTIESDGTGCFRIKVWMDTAELMVMGIADIIEVI